MQENEFFVGTTRAVHKALVLINGKWVQGRCGIASPFKLHFAQSTVNSQHTIWANLAGATPARIVHGAASASTALVNWLEEAMTRLPLVTVT